MFLLRFASLLTHITRLLIICPDRRPPFPYLSPSHRSCSSAVVDAMTAQGDIESAKGTVIVSEQIGEDLATLVSRRQIRYDDDEIQHVGRAIHRTRSTQSMRSTHSIRTRRSIDPAVALPIQYQTLSYNIEDGQHRTGHKSRDGKIGKSNAADEIAKADWHTLSEGDICKAFRTDSSHGLSSDQIQTSTLR